MTKLLKELCSITGHNLTNIVIDKTILLEIDNEILIEALNFADACNQIETKLC